MTELAYYKGDRTEEHATPQDLFNELDNEFHFTLDPCATHENAKCEKYYTKADDGLSKDWSNQRVFMNPPYGREIAKWVEKAFISWNDHALVVGLLPARTDTRYFHDFIYRPYLRGLIEIRFLRGRIKFSNNKPAPFPSMIVIWGKR